MTVTLFDLSRGRNPPEKKSIQERFEEFDQQHPEIYKLFKRFSQDLIDAGYLRGSADMILHRIRWETAVNQKHHQGFKMNNVFSSRYARKLAAEDPQYQTFFEFRKLKAS